jgi:iron transport multicopper oxidase
MVQLYFSSLTIAALIWDWQNVSFPVRPGTAVRFHILNMGARALFNITIAGHFMWIIEVDGVYVKPYPTVGINIHIGQRYSVVVEMDADPSQNYPILAVMDTAKSNPSVTGWLIYNDSAPRPPGVPIPFRFDDTNLHPYIPVPVIPSTRNITFVVTFENTGPNGTTRAAINGVSYEAPFEPTMFTALQAANPFDPTIYGNKTNTNLLHLNEMIWLIIQSKAGIHPCNSCFYLKRLIL